MRLSAFRQKAKVRPEKWKGKGREVERGQQKIKNKRIPVMRGLHGAHFFVKI